MSASERHRGELAARLRETLIERRRADAAAEASEPRANCLDRTPPTPWSRIVPTYGLAADRGEQMLFVMATVVALGLAAALLLARKEVTRLRVDVAREGTRAEAAEKSLAAAREDADRERSERIGSQQVVDQLQEFRAGVEQAKEKSEEASQQAQEVRNSVEAETAKGLAAIQGLVTRFTRPKGRGQLSEGWLATILEGVGLREGVSYRRDHRVAIEKPDGETAIGVVDYYLCLPGGGGIALDAKYPFARAEDLLSDNEILQKKAREEVRSSLRAHIKGLADRRYQDARDCQVDAVFLVLPSWEEYALARAVAPELWEFARQMRVSIVPADGVFEIAESVALVHRLADTTGKIAQLHDPHAVGRMYDTSLTLLDALIRAVESHNTHGVHLCNIIKSFAPNGKFRHDVLDVLGDATNRAGPDKGPAEVKELPVERARTRLDQLGEKAEELGFRQAEG